jgi:hypothetical protein
MMRSDGVDVGRGELMVRARSREGMPPPFGYSSFH